MSTIRSQKLRRLNGKVSSVARVSASVIFLNIKNVYYVCTKLSTSHVFLTGKVTRKSAASKSTGSLKAPPAMRGSADGIDAVQGHQFTPPKPPVQPLPSVETVASQLRNARSLEVAPPQLLSPNHINSGRYMLRHNSENYQW